MLEGLKRQAAGSTRKRTQSQLTAWARIGPLKHDLRFCGSLAGRMLEGLRKRATGPARKIVQYELADCLGGC